MGKKRLSDVVSEIVDGVLMGEVINVRAKAVERWDDIDDDGHYMAGIEGLCARVSNKSRDVKVSVQSKRHGKQMDLPFMLPAAVAMDIDGNQLLPTWGLSRAEFVRAIAIRKQQIMSDQAAVREWEEALDMADAYWAIHPEWTFGQCLRAYTAAAAGGRT